MRATLWNRTRTSRASAERADHLRKSGIVRERRPLSCGFSRVIIIDYSFFIRPVLAVSLSSHYERCARGTVDSRAMQSACSSGRKIRTFVMRSRGAGPTVRRSLIMFVGSGRIELPLPRGSD